MAEPKPVISTHALVFGASGLVGWGVVDQLMENYPTEGTFSKVTALVNRPFTLAESYWPSPSASRPELELVSNIDLTQGTVEEFTALLEKKVPDIASVTHVFYFGRFDGEMFVMNQYAPTDEGIIHVTTSLQTRARYRP